MVDSGLSRIDKLVDKLRARPVQASIGDVRKVLDAYGWKERPQTSGTSHLTFRKPGDSRLLTIPIDSGKTVKAVYLAKIREFLELDD